MSVVLLSLLLGCTKAPDDTDVDGGVAGDNGVVRFDVAFDPAPPTAGTVVASVALTAITTDAPIEGATVTVEPYMPSMGHGSGEVIVTEEGGGLYLAQWSFSMPGVWEVRIAVDEPADETTVTVDVE